MTEDQTLVAPVLPDGERLLREYRKIVGLTVVRDGQLIGIVSRDDLVKALAASAQPPPTESLVSDSAPHVAESVAVSRRGAANARLSRRGWGRRSRA